MSKIKAALEAARKQQHAPPGHSLAPASANDGDSGASAKYISIASLPQVTVDPVVFEENRFLTHNKRHPAEAAYRMLRTRLMQKLRSSGQRIIGVSSLTQNEGKTFTAINLAISIAAEVGQDAVIVDLDLRRPSVYSCLGVDARAFKSVTRYFDDSQQTIDRLLVRLESDRLGCLMSATPLGQPSDVLASTRGKQLFDELSTRLSPQTIVIVDLPPLLAVDDALAVAPMLDGLLLVVAEGHTKRSDLADARELLQEFNVIGALLNKSVEKDLRGNYSYY